MGVIKFKGNVVYTGDLAAANINDGWNDSMAEYYPSLTILYVVGDDIKHSTISVPGFVDPRQRNDFVYELDTAQVAQLHYIQKARKDAEEAVKITLHKRVIVVRGRKVPKGTEGEVFWMGDSGYGMSVGLRLQDGKTVFTALKNVEVLNVDKAFEHILLKD